MTKLLIGDMAPDFNLTDHDGNIFSLSQSLAHGPVVLVFYTMDGSPNCTALLCGINDDVAEFQHHGLQIVGINNAEPERHGKLVRKKMLQLQLLSDNQYEVARQYNSLYEIGPIRAIRYSVVGIGQDGRIKYLQRGKPSNAEIFVGMGVVPAAV